MVLIRAALSQIFPQLDQILSLDVDTIVNENISDLWDRHLSHEYLAAVPEPEKTKQYGYTYINMGVALFNLKKLREDKMDLRIIEALNTKFYDYNEQDCISEMCQGHIYELLPDYNVCNYTDHYSAHSRKIIHFAAIKNWNTLPEVTQYKNVWLRRNLEDKQPVLDIIIPTYNNAAALRRTLQSLSPMNHVRITVVNDCCNKDYEEYQRIEQEYDWVSFMSLPMNSGPGMARQVGMDYTNGTHIMFIDAGDYLISYYNLLEIMDYITEDRMPDLYLFRWLNEENNQFSSANNPLLHGWIFKREFLDLHDITFSREGSYLNEDVGFTRACNLIINNMKLYDETEHFKFIETPIYMYTLDPNSITHKNNKEFLYTRQTQALITNAKHSFNIALKNNVHESILIEEACAIMVGLYLDFLNIAAKHPEYLPDNWRIIRTYYMDIFKQYEKKSEEAMRIMFGQRIKTLLRASNNKRTPPLNIRRFLCELQENENCPINYLT